MKITVAGAGAFGTAMACALTEEHGDVALWGRDAVHMAEMARDRRNAVHLPNVELPTTIAITSQTETLETADVILLCIPTQKLPTFLTAHKSSLTEKPLIACCKGLDLKTQKGPVETILAHVPGSEAGILTGPSFAADIAQGLPTALTLAFESDEIGKTLQNALSRPALRIYTTKDVTGAQLGGALKNVIAIASGACIGAGYGESARAALIARGFAEMCLLAERLGAQSDTLRGLSGLGDLVLTCGSTQSRNFAHGVALAQGIGTDGSKTLEGVASAEAVVALAREHGLQMPISEAVASLVTGKTTVTEALSLLLSRPLRNE